VYGCSRLGVIVVPLNARYELRVNTIGFLAHDIVILLDPKNIVENIHDAYQHVAFREDKYAVLMTGPSGSADIGGKTVHRAQGVMTLTVIMWPADFRPEGSKASGSIDEN
jgi:L-lactate utilization protein LutC